MPMQSGLMMFKPMEQYQGKPVDLDGFLELVAGWGLETLDIFLPFLGDRPASEVRAAMDRHGRHLRLLLHWNRPQRRRRGGGAEVTGRLQARH
jgi:hypothetical protein